MNRNHRIKRILLCLAALLALPLLSASADGEQATDLSDCIRIAQSGHSGARDMLLDARLDETVEYLPFETIRLTWDCADAATLCIQWGALPQRVRIRQIDAADNILDESYAEPVWDAILPLVPGAAGVCIMADASGMDLARLALFSAGTLPAPFYAWQDTPRGMDYLLIATHPDDDVLFMGGVIPICGAEQGYVGTVAYVTNPSRKRVNEAMLGAWEMGARVRPIFIGFPDIRGSVKDDYPYRFRQETVTLALVRMLREYRPLVVFTQDLNGEYGHWQHLIVSASVLDAVQLCADPTFDPLSYAEFGAWEVQKCYIHLYEENPLVMDIDAPLTAFGGRTATEVAQEAFLQHKSQQSGRFAVHGTGDRYPMNRFGMAYGTVAAGTDVFDGIDPTLLSTYTAPAETPTPAPEPTAPPTDPPTPTEPPKPTEPPAPTAPPAPTEPPKQAAPAEPVPSAARFLFPILGVILGAAAASACFLLFRKRHS